MSVTSLLAIYSYVLLSIHHQ